MKPRRTDVLMVGGGSVGHLAPAFAVAEILREGGWRVSFATPGEAGEAAWFAGEAETPLCSSAPRLPLSKMGIPVFGLRLGRAVWQAQTLLRRERPAVVVGLGGWPCVPASLAARLTHTPLALLASDVKPGVAVRRLAPLASRIYVVRGEAARALGGGPRVLCTGPVLRREILQAGGRTRPERWGLEPGRLTLFVVGGSLGARALNQGVAEGVAAAVEARPDLRAELQVLHAVGKSGGGVEEAYTRAGVAHHVTPFVQEMAEAYRMADLVLARAGALTCQEIEAVGVPAVFVPYPHHADRQQYENARPLVERGGALLLEEKDLDAAAVRETLIALLEDGPRRAAMARRMAAPGAKDGALQIAADLVRFLG